MSYINPEIKLISKSNPDIYFTLNKNIGFENLQHVTFFVEGINNQLKHGGDLYLEVSEAVKT